MLNFLILHKNLLNKMANTQKEIVEVILVSAENFIESTNLKEVDKFVFKQSFKNEKDKTVEEWEKIKMNIFS